MLKAPEKGTKTIDLIMDQNINSDGTPAGMDNIVTKENKSNKYNVVSWNNEEGQGTNAYGPVTALKFLNEATKGWTNLKPINYEYKDKEFIVSTTYGYNSLIINKGVVSVNETPLKLKQPMYARMPIYAIIYNSQGESKVYGEVDAKKSDNSNEFLYKNLRSNNISQNGYWTLSSHSSSDSGAMVVYNFGIVLINGVTDGSGNGVRPVITLDI